MPEDVTGSLTSFTFDPRAILLGEFPTDLAPDMDPQIASGLVAQNARNQIRINCPGGRPTATARPPRRTCHSSSWCRLWRWRGS